MIYFCSVELEIVHNIFGQVITPKKQVTSINELDKGMHVAFKRNAYWHHGIIEKKEANKIHTIEYNLKIMRCVHDFGGEEKFYVVEDDQGDKTVEELDEIVERAIESMRKQDNYNPLYRNCEHFANSCSKGEEASGQSEQYWRMLVLLIGRILVDICLFFFNFGMVTFLAKARPLAGRIEDSRSAWCLILKLLLATILEGCFVVYDIHEGRKFNQLNKSCCSRKLCSAVISRVILAITSIGFMVLFSWLAIKGTDINHAGTVMLAGSFGTLFGYGIGIIIVRCIKMKDGISCMAAVVSCIKCDAFFKCIAKPRGTFNVSCIICLTVLLNLTSFCFNCATYVRESWWDVPINGKNRICSNISYK